MIAGNFTITEHQVPEIILDETMARATDLARSENYGDLARLSNRLLEADANGFLANYFRGVAAMGLGETVSGREHIKKAEAIVPRVRKFDFLTPLLRRRGAPEVEVVFQRLALMLNFEVTDTYLLSYPKCGRTWVRLILATYALRGEQGDPLDVAEISHEKDGLSTIEISHDDYPHWKPSSQITDEKSAYQDKRIIFLTRDPRDVMVSYYFQYTLRGDKDRAGNAAFNGDLAAFMRQDIGGLKSLVRYYNVWAANRDEPASFMLITYEDLHKDVRASLREIVDFMGWPDYGPDVLDQAVAAGSFDNMRRLEADDTLGNVRLRPPADGNPEGFKVRRGVVGGFRDYLADEDIAWMENYLDSELDDYFGRYKYFS